MTLIVIGLSSAGQSHRGRRHSTRRSGRRSWKTGIVLELLRRWGAAQAQGMSVELVDAARQLPMAYRNTIANMMAEAEALNGIFAAPLPSRIVTARRVPGCDWQRFENCADDGFATAAETLDRRIARLGATSDAVRRWLEAQDLVFSNCASGAAIPSAPEVDLPPELAADRRYIDRILYGRS